MQITHRLYISHYTGRTPGVKLSDDSKRKCMKRDDSLLCKTLINIFTGTGKKSKNIIDINNGTTKKMIQEQLPVISNQFPKGELEDLSLLWLTVLFGFHRSAELLVFCGAEVNELFNHQQRYDITEKSSILHVLLLMEPSLQSDRLMKEIIEKGAVLNAQDMYGRTPLHYAAKYGRIEVAKMLLERGAYVDAADNYSVTPLLYAAKTSEAGELLPMFMNKGANINSKCINNSNVLHRLSGAPQEHINLARILIQKGVSLEDREDQRQFQPIHVAAEENKHQLVS